MIKILSIEIFGFKHQSRKCNIHFSEENISVIYGINGSGKTTLLNILGAILSQDESILLKENVEKIVLCYSIDDIEKEPIIIDRNDESDSTVLSAKEGQLEISTKLYNCNSSVKI
jgi:predicted ATP-binding protein involved in virulence